MATPADAAKGGQGTSETLPREGPANLLRLPESEEPLTVFLVDKSTQEFFVYEGSGRDFRLVETLPCTTGRVRGDKLVEGDLKTPEGVYWFRRYIPDEALPPLYGAGAFTMDYPNDFDRLDGKTGSGIWMHGVETDARVDRPRDTRGCVALRNPDFDRMTQRVSLVETPIVVVEQRDFLSRETLADDLRELEAVLEDWRDAWTNRDTERYLSHYDPQFSSQGKSLEEWAAQKRRLSQRANTIQVATAGLSAFREKDRAWLTFRQEYISDGHADVGMKVLSLRETTPASRDWKIIGERWRPLEEDFLLLDPESVPDLSEATIEALHPDAAPTEAGDEVVSQARTLADKPRELVASLEPTPQRPVDAEPSPPPVESEGTPAPEDLDAVAAPAEKAQVRVLETEAEPEPELTAALPLPPVLRTSLAAPDYTRGLLRLFRPSARRQGEGFVLDVQLMNQRPAVARKGTLRITMSIPGVDDVLPHLGMEGVRYDIRQGQLLSWTLPAPRAVGPMSVEVVAVDAHEREILRQTIQVHIPGQD